MQDKESLVRGDTETVIFGKSNRAGFYKLAQKLQGPFAEEAYLATQDYLRNSGFSSKNAFSGRHFNYDGKLELITGSSPFISVAIQTSFLNEKNLWLPDVREGKILESKGKLTNRVYRDFSGVVYNNAEPNKDIAQALILQAGERKFPLILPFKCLTLTEAENTYGAGFKIASQEGIIEGEEAQKIIKSLNFFTSFGFRRLCRDGGGDWVAYWNDDLAVSGAYGRGEWVCGEATQKNLEDALNFEISREYTAKRTEIEAQLKGLADEEQAFRNESLKIFNQ